LFSNVVRGGIRPSPQKGWLLKTNCKKKKEKGGGKEEGQLCVNIQTGGPKIKVQSKGGGGAWSLFDQSKVG